MFTRRILIILFPIIFSHELCFAQHSKTIIIHSDNEKILMPIIENELYDLRQGDVRYFTKINNLNEIYHNIATDESLRGLLSKLTAQDFHLTKEEKRMKQEIADTLIKYDYLLNIHINRVNALLEYQFYLYDSKALLKSKNADWPVNNVSRPLYYTSFIVDINTDYAQKIRLEIAKMFPATKQIPVAVLTNGFSKEREYTINLGDSLVLDATQSYDSSLTNSALTYFWYRKRTSENSEEDKLIRVSNQPSYIYSTTKIETNYVYLKVFNGVNYSLVDSVLIYSNKRPKIFAPERKIYSYYVKALWKSKKDRFDAYVPIIASNLPVVNTSTVMVDDTPESLDTFNIMKKQYGASIFSIFHKKDSANLDMDDVSKTTENKLNYRIAKTNRGFAVIFDQAPDFDVYRNYHITVRNKSLFSNTEKITVRNRIFSPLLLYTGYSELNTALFGKADTAYESNSGIHVGLSARLYSNTGKNIFIEYSVGTRVSYQSKAAVNEVLRTGFSFTYMPFSFGVFYQRLQYDYVVSGLGKVTADRGTFAGSFGLETGLSSRIPIYVHPEILFSLKQIPLPGVQPVSNFILCFSIKYALPKDLTLR